MRNIKIYSELAQPADTFTMHVERDTLEQCLVMAKSGILNGELFINGESQGIAFVNVPQITLIVDMGPVE